LWKNKAFPYIYNYGLKSQDSVHFLKHSRRRNGPRFLKETDEGFDEVRKGEEKLNDEETQK
jgi:hypothetical protein